MESLLVTHIFNLLPEQVRNIFLFHLITNSFYVNYYGNN